MAGEPEPIDHLPDRGSDPANPTDHVETIAGALVGAAPWMGHVERVTADLATLAGLGLAPESHFRNG